MPGLLKGVSIRGLEVFEALAQTRSVGEAAQRLGMSAPAVSQQLKNLSTAVGMPLVDPSRRPMTLTPAGHQFLQHVETALGALRDGQRDLTLLDLSDVSVLRLGVIEDFENEVTPTLTTRLAETMQNCKFRLQTGASHTLISHLDRSELDMVISAEGPTAPSSARLHPLLEDPYILAVPKGIDVSAGLTALTGLPLIRRDQDQIMGQQVEAALHRSGLAFPNRIEMDSNQSISALVALGHGWTVTTPLSLLRAGRFLQGIDAHPLPLPPMSRRISLIAGGDWTDDIPGQIAQIARDLIQTHFTAPGLQLMPWLKGQYRSLESV